MTSRRQLDRAVMLGDKVTDPNVSQFAANDVKRLL